MTKAPSTACLKNKTKEKPKKKKKALREIHYFCQATR